MDDGTPSRFRYAQELGAMLGTVALLGSDIVEVHMLADGSSYTGARLAAPHLITELIEEVSELPRGTRTDLAASLRDYRRGAEPADLAVLLTDGLAERAGAGRSGRRAVAARPAAPPSSTWSRARRRWRRSKAPSSSRTARPGRRSSSR